MTGRLTPPTGRYGGRSAEERQADRRRRFLDAALQLFGAGPGFRGTTVAGLSEAAGLSTRQFYEEFRTLEDVLAALHLTVDGRAERSALESLAATEGRSVTERATAACHAYAAHVTGDPRRLRVTSIEVVGAGPRLERQRLERRGRWTDLVCAEAAAAAERGEAAGRDHRLAATVFVGGVNGLLHEWQSGRFDAGLDEIVEELVRLLLGFLRPPGWAPGR